ncbi:MAG: hypothetical protein OEW88_03215 [Gammaproteobacteria bacterium]|nr:hypothetical protein [Gammaproteobacteria bacterium]
MKRARTMCAIALLGLLTGTAASADGRNGYRDHGSGGYYQSGPQVRLGVDVVWGAYPYAPPRYAYVPRPPPVVWYPAYYQPYRGYDRGYGRGHSRGKRHNHHHHRH